MSKIALLIFIIAAPTLAGIAVVVVLTIGMSTAKSVITAAVVGTLLAIPAAIMVAKGIGKIA